jgi:hypothetical protein
MLPIACMAWLGIRARNHIVAGIVVVVAVSVLTLLFSFLGTITSGAVFGMMFGPLKQSKWQVSVVSCVFPLVSLAFSQLVTLERSLVLAALCFGVFWASYLLTRTALYFESSQLASSAPAVAHRSEGDQQGTTGASETRAEPAYDPSLEELQGRWARQGASRDSPSSVEAIEIAGDRLLMTVCGADGKLRTVWGGHVVVKQVGPYKVAVLAAEPNQETIPTRFRAPTWLYRVMDEKLTIAWNLDDASPGEDPVFENYRKGAAGPVTGSF